MTEEGVPEVQAPGAENEGAARTREGRAPTKRPGLSVQTAARLLPGQEEGVWLLLPLSSTL